MPLLIAPLALSTAIALIEGFEGVEERAYVDAAGVTTICAGLTRYPNGSPVRRDDVCSKSVCRAYLESMLKDQFIPPLTHIPGWKNFGPKRQAVLISFAWNLGADFYNKKGFETISSVLTEGASKPEVYDKLPSALSLYTKANGKELQGLVIRRKKEGDLWASESNGSMKFKCHLSTFLKKAPIESIYLSNDGKLACEFGETIDVSQVDDIAEDCHKWVTLEGSGERWAIYQPHWSEISARPSLDEWEKVDWGDFGAHLGPYLTVGEVLQYDMRRRPEPGSREEEELYYLAGQFNLIREAWGGPIGIVSGYRPEPINTRVGGIPGSYHTKGMALDIYPVGESCSVFFKWLSRRWTGGLGDGCTKGFIHIDTRGDGEFEQRAGVRPCSIWAYQ